MNKTLLKAIFDCKKEIPAIEKKAIAKLGTYSYKYADLPDVQTAIKTPMENQGLIFVHKIVRQVDPNTGHESRECLQTDLILVETGDAIWSMLEIPPGKFQERGASITYAKRYNIGCLLDLVLDEDIDGPKEEGKKEIKPKVENKPEDKPIVPPQGKQANNSLMTVLQGKRLWTIAKLHGWDEPRIRKFMKTRFNIESTKELTKFNYDILCSAIEMSPKIENTAKK